MPKYFDIHSHLNFRDYDKDRQEVIKRLKESDTHTIVIGTDFASSQSAVELANAHEGLYASIGVHPIRETSSSNGTSPVDFDVAEFEKLVKHPKVVAVGECGLDFYHAKKETDFERQKKLFLGQALFAIEHNKPLMIHARPARTTDIVQSGGNAYEELLGILEPLKREHGAKLRGNVHFFAGSWEVAQRFFAFDFTVSFTGVITFVRDYDEIIKKAPLEWLMAETDAPFVAPVPYRGGRNEPGYVSEVVKSMAAIRGEDEEQVRIALVNNALRMIG